MVEDDEMRGRRAVRLVVGVGGLEVFLSLFMVKEMRIEFTVQHSTSKIIYTMT